MPLKPSRFAVFKSLVALHVVGLVACLTPVIRVCFSVFRVRSYASPMRRHGPSRRPVGPLMLESWWRGLFRAAFGTATPKRCCREAGSPVSDSRRRRSRQFQVRDRLSFQVALFSRLRHVVPSFPRPVSRLTCLRPVSRLSRQSLRSRLRPVGSVWPGQC